MPWDSLHDASTNKARPSISPTTTDHANIVYPRWFGGSASCLAVFLTHPLDLVKVQMQAAAKGPDRLGAIATAVRVCKHDGVTGLYRGLTAGFARQLIYGSTRFAMYDIFKEAINKSPSTDNDHAGSHFASLVAAASISGFVAGVAGNPADLANVRMQSDSTLPASQRRNYSNVFGAWRAMAHEPGGFVRTALRGVWANSIRAAIMTSSQLSAYDVFKDALLNRAGMSDDLATHFVASTLAGLVATTLCSPVDVIKTQIMNASASETRPIAKLIRDNFAQQGPKWMLRGWVPSFMRLGPQTVAVFVILEQHRKIYRYWHGIE